MATGVPARATNRLRAASDGSSAITLAYPGKRTEEAIRQTSPARVQSVWAPSPGAGAEAPNRLYYGDNLGVLAALRNDPAVRSHVRLVYIDPPYASGGAYLSRGQEPAYADTLGGAEYVESLRARLVLLHDLLAPDGSIYVHLDDYMAWTIKLVMDEIFGPQNYRNWITRKKCNPKNYTRNAYGNISDFILFYTKSDDYVWHRPLEAWTPERRDKEYEFVDEQGRRHKRVPLHAPGVRKGATGEPWRGMSPPPGKHWQYLPATLDEMDAHGDIYWSKNGNPRRKVYFEESQGVPVQDMWLDCRDVHNQNTKITGYPTEKPVRLLDRIIAASSNPGDIVLDCYAGSGTTLDVASELGRRWIGVDNSLQSITTILNRFAYGLQPMGDYVAMRKDTATTRNAGSVKDEDDGDRAPRQLMFAMEDDGVYEEVTSRGSGLHVLSAKREPIRDFTLMAEESVAGDLSSDVLARFWPW